MEDAESVTEPKPSSALEDEASESEEDLILHSSRHYWAKGVKMPVFEGEDPLGWITCGEVCFRATRPTERESEIGLYQYGGKRLALVPVLEAKGKAEELVCFQGNAD